MDESLPNALDMENSKKDVAFHEAIDKNIDFYSIGQGLWRPHLSEVSSCCFKAGKLKVSKKEATVKLPHVVTSVLRFLLVTSFERQVSVLLLFASSSQISLLLQKSLPSTPPPLPYLIPPMQLLSLHVELFSFFMLPSRPQQPQISGNHQKCKLLSCPSVFLGF